MVEDARVRKLDNLIAVGERASADDERSGEVFPCPHCGQMLGPAVRVCVSCRQPIDPDQIRRPAAVLPFPVTPQPTLPAATRARFSWPIFFWVLTAWFVAAAVSQQLLGTSRSQMVMASVVILSSGWVFFDAQERRVPKPLRWGLGSLLLWIVVFPWYLARRRTPEAPCPFVEAEASPLARALFFVLMVFFLLSVVLILLKGPPPK